MEWSTASARGAGLSLQLRVNKPTGPVGDCCVGGWVQPLVDNAILHLSELETGGVRLLGHQITSPPEQRRVDLLVYDNIVMLIVTALQIRRKFSQRVLTVMHKPCIGLAQRTRCHQYARQSLGVPSHGASFMMHLHLTN